MRIGTRYTLYGDRRLRYMLHGAGRGRLAGVVVDGAAGDARREVRDRHAVHHAAGGGGHCYALCRVACEL